MATYFGIDVAKYQGDIDWQKVAKSQNGAFAILKVTKKDNTVEESFEKNYAGATAAGIPAAGYRYMYAQDEAQGEAEAKAIVASLGGRKLPGGIWIDAEDKSIRYLGKDQLTAIINAEAKVFEAAGYTVGIYCNLDWYKNVLDTQVLSEKYKFWIARYPANDNGTVKENLNPRTITNCDIWQYSSKGVVPGIVGNVDLNVAYRQFWGEVPKNDPYPLNEGDVGENVKHVQDLLQNKWEIYCAGVTGVFGSATKAAVIEFQLISGLAMDGVVGPATLTALEAPKFEIKNQYAYQLQRALNLEGDARLVCDGNIGPATVAECPVLTTKSACNQIIKAYQEILTNVYGIKVGVTGLYDTVTKNGTKTLQSHKGLKADGYAGPATWTAISKDI